MRIAVGADHAGYNLKNIILEILDSMNHEIIDVGAYSFDPSDDYPDFSVILARKIASGDADKGIMVCGSGVGASVTANKIDGVRAAICHDIYSAHQGVEHDDMNILCLGARVVGIEVAKELIGAFVRASFTGEERHIRRLGKLIDIERQCLQNDT